jgi:hypothetical protein
MAAGQTDGDKPLDCRELRCFAVLYRLPDKR